MIMMMLILLFMAVLNENENSVNAYSDLKSYIACHIL
jgi:hypothetical protein